MPIPVGMADGTGEGAILIAEAVDNITMEVEFSIIRAAPGATPGGMEDTTAPLPAVTVVAMAMLEGTAEVVVLQEDGMAPEFRMAWGGCFADSDSEVSWEWLRRR